MNGSHVHTDTQTHDGPSATLMALISARHVYVYGKFMYYTSLLHQRTWVQSMCTYLFMRMCDFYGVCVQLCRLLCLSIFDCASSFFFISHDHPWHCQRENRTRENSDWTDARSSFTVVKRENVAICVSSQIVIVYSVEH